MTKRAGIAMGSKARFRADKQRRGSGGSIQPEATSLGMLSDTASLGKPSDAASLGKLPSSASSNDPNADTLKGVRDVASGDLHATSAVAGVLSALLTPTSILKLLVGGGAARSVIEDAKKAAEYWSTPEAHKALPELYPTGGSFPP
ncbi:MAG: hypothetical protein ACLQJR_07620 [Stellaceae bacterium]